MHASIPSAVKTGDTFSIAVNDGTGSTTITATVAADSAAYGATDVAAALNQANQVLATPVGVTFGVDGNGNITTTYDDALGDIADERVVNLGEVEPLWRQTCRLFWCHILCHNW